MKVLLGVPLPLMLSTHTPEEGMVLPDHFVLMALKNSSFLVPANVLPAKGADEQRPGMSFTWGRRSRKTAR